MRNTVMNRTLINSKNTSASAEIHQKRGLNSNIDTGILEQKKAYDYIPVDPTRHMSFSPLSFAHLLIGPSHMS